jgi:hypothetical protein
MLRQGGRTEPPQMRGGSGRDETERAGAEVQKVWSKPVAAQPRGVDRHMPGF